MNNIKRQLKIGTTICSIIASNLVFGQTNFFNRYKPENEYTLLTTANGFKKKALHH